MQSWYHISGMTGPSDTRKVGRPRTGWTQVGIKLAPDLVAQIDGWRDRQPDTPARPEAIRRLVTDALRRDGPTTAAPTQSQASNFGDRERVRSHIYGIGTIVGRVTDRSSSPMFDRAGTSGLAATVRWDDASWGMTEVAIESLEPVVTKDQRRPG